MTITPILGMDCRKVAVRGFRFSTFSKGVVALLPLFTNVSFRCIINSAMKVTRNCEVCGKQLSHFTVLGHEYEVRFCSYECKNAAQTIKLDVECPNCGKLFHLQPWYFRNGKTHFCSRECYDAIRKRGSQIVNCDFCGKEVYRKPVFVANLKHHFCSKLCYTQWLHFHRVYSDNPNWRGGKERYYGPNWSDQAELARKRDNYKCQKCGCEAGWRELDVHHIVPFRTFGLRDYEEANALSNLITLCVGCHPKSSKWIIPSVRLPTAQTSAS